HFKDKEGARRRLLLRTFVLDDDEIGVVGRAVVAGCTMTVQGRGAALADRAVLRAAAVEVGDSTVRVGTVEDQHLTEIGEGARLWDVAEVQRRMPFTTPDAGAWRGVAAVAEAEVVALDRNRAAADC